MHPLGARREGRRHRRIPAEPLPDLLRAPHRPIRRTLTLALIRQVAAAPAAEPADLDVEEPSALAAIQALPPGPAPTVIAVRPEDRDRVRHVLPLSTAGPRA